MVLGGPRRDDGRGGPRTCPGRLRGVRQRRRKGLLDAQHAADDRRRHAQPPVTRRANDAGGTVSIARGGELAGSMKAGMSSTIPWDDYAPEQVETLVAAWLIRVMPGAQRVDGAGGDDGADVRAPVEGGRHIFEIKSFSRRLTRANKRQIARSLATAVERQPDMARWTLVLPLDLSPAEIRWFEQNLAPSPPVPVDWVGRTVLEAGLSEHCDLLRSFAPGSVERRAMDLLVEYNTGQSDDASGRTPLPQVRDCDPRQLGVHASIGGDPAASPRPSQPLPFLPLYVTRDIDQELREVLAEAAERSGLVVLVGGSSTGKTRTAYEAIKAELDDWRLLHPASGADLAEAQRAQLLHQGRVVVWLDEFHRYLTGTDALTIGAVRQLLDPTHPIAAIATIWPQWYERFTTLPPSEQEDDDPHWDARQILTTTAQVIRVSDFDEGERSRAQLLANKDPRLYVALQDQYFSPTQVLAAAPQLVDRWQHAANPYANALITAAVDYRRFDHRGLLTTDLLRDGAPGYLTGQQFATAPNDWLDRAIDYATAKLHGATSPLIPLPGHAIGTTAGYTVADYLVQHGVAVRFLAAPPRSLWESAITHVTDADDRTRLGSAAEWRHLNRYAALLFEAGANAGVTLAMRGLAHVLQAASRTDDAATWLRRAVDAGDRSTEVLARGLEQSGYLDESVDLLTRAADAGDPAARYQLAKLFERHGRIGDATTAMRQAAEAGYPAAVTRVARSLWSAEQPDEAIELLQAAIASGDNSTASASTRSSLVRQLADTYQGSGNRSRALAVLDEAAQAGDTSAIKALGRLLVESTDPDDVERGLGYLRRVADEGDPSAMSDLASGLRSIGCNADADEWLRHAAWAGDPNAIEELSMTLPRDEAIEWLKEHASTNAFALTKLAELLDRPTAIVWLREVTEAGNSAAMETLIWVLRDSGQTAEAERWLRLAVEAGEVGAFVDLVKLLDDTERKDEAARLRRYGIEPGGSTAEAWS